MHDVGSAGEDRVHSAVQEHILQGSGADGTDLRE